MKKIVLLALLASCFVNAQKKFVPSHGYGKGEYVIVQNDGKKIKANTIEFDADDAKFKYKTSSDKGKFKYDEIKEITSSQNTVFRPFPEAKLKGGFVISESESRILVVMPFTKTAGRPGGMQTDFEHFILSILDKSGKVIEEFDLMTSKSKKSKEISAGAIQAIKKNFSDCPIIIKFVTGWESSDDVGSLGGHFMATCAQKGCE